MKFMNKNSKQLKMSSKGKKLFKAYVLVSGLYHLSLYRRKGYHWYEDKDGKFEGAFVEVEDDGHLILHDKKGVIRSYAFGEIKFLIPSVNIKQ